MALNHVCTWHKNGWKRITASEAAKTARYGVSARSGLFMCELCGQYVVLTKAGLRDPYFKHSKSEEDKNCEERSLASNQASYGGRLNTEKRGLPIRIVSDGIRQHFEIGFPRLGDLLNELPKNSKIQIISDNGQDFNYLFERLNQDSMTYFSVGNRMSREYTIRTTVDNNELSFFLPQRVKGVSKETVFSVETGVVIPKGSDVYVNKEYYLLLDFDWLENQSSNHVHIEKVQTTLRIPSHYSLYKVKALDFSEESAKFFLNCYCRLEEKPISFIPIWPITVKSPFHIYHNSKFLYGVMSGNATFQTYPYGFVSSAPLEDSNLLKIRCDDRKQIIALGRFSNVLNYSYLWREKLEFEDTHLTSVVLDAQGNIIDSLSEEKVKEIHYIPEYDGKFIVEKDGFLIENYALSSGDKFIYNDFQRGRVYKLYQGLDLMWTYKASDTKQKLEHVFDDNLVFKKLKKCKSPYIEISHSYGVVANSIKSNYPKTTIWLRKQIKMGYISKEAMIILNELKNAGGTIHE
ncbi:hypothetical protein DW257_02555 [Catenibacterium sp. AM22-15]|uniref:hypothetical protein n=1 Tax=unclassified Catenibacterium TaxID=2643636 RepID=UPI000E3F25CA|nr:MULTISPECIES: hypothetical protein [unclassified Catenibacterium]RGE99748.1 hypothetical protein DW269_01935 [Catenibacterium sp. AM22-6LB]RGF08867.1 hypothetical protein DW257_02555 [Catenibacterium sp. AM22-15]